MSKAKGTAEALSRGVTYRDVTGYNGYRVGDDGSVWSCLRKSNAIEFRFSDEWRILSAHLDSDGYRRVSLAINGVQKIHRVARLVLTEFVGPCPEGHQACHGDGVRTHDWLDNLRWDTAQENQHDR